MDLTFKTEQGRFNYRVGAVILKDGCVLLVKNEKADYYYSVGGRVRFDESCEQAVKREVKEELGIELEIDRPLFFHEHFFDEQITHEHYHEISVYYLMRNSDELDNCICSSTTEDGAHEYLTWIPLSKINKETVYPELYQRILKDLPDSFVMISDKQ